MIRQLIKLVWKKRRKNALLIVELLISFMVLFAIFSTLIYNYSNYFQGYGYRYEDAWVLDFNWPSADDETVMEKLTAVRQHLLSEPEIESVSFCKVTYPFSFSNMTTDEQGVSLQFIICDTGYFTVLQMPFVEGKGFTLDDRMLRLEPVVLNKKAADLFFPGERATGQLFGTDSNMVVTGVVEKYRYSSSFAEDEPSLFKLSALSDSTLGIMSNAIIRVRPGTGRPYEASLVKELLRLLPGWTVKVNWLTDLRQTKDNMAMGFIWIMIIVAAFLIMNVIFGLFGLVWYNINLRKAEIGLRRALGATNREITRQFVSETMVLTTMAVLVGLLFAIQFPMMEVFTIQPGVYLIAILLSLLFLYGLVLLSAIIPSRKVSGIEPAVSLHEE
jgi:putative ABC transport system permease protein